MNDAENGNALLSHEDRNKEVVREFTRIFKNEHNVDGVGHLFDSQFVHHFRTRLPDGFEGASGDRVVERSSADATHQGSLMGSPPTNKRVHWSEIHIYRLKDGKIAEHWAEIAMMELLQQTGVLRQIGV